MTKPVELEQLLPILLKYGVAPDRAPIIRRFHEILIEENSRQNLTRIIEPTDFIEGHLLDCLEALKLAEIEYPALDLGSGGGVPGLLCAIIQPNEWILMDSEIQKASFLARAADLLKADSVQVVHGRIETELSHLRVGSIVVRAVGKVEKIFGWIRNCSTWNNLVLFKGPGWGVEWEEFQQSGSRNKLQIILNHPYTIGDPPKTRAIVKLTRKQRAAL